MLKRKIRPKVAFLTLVVLLAVVAWLSISGKKIYNARSTFTPCLQIPAKGEHWAQPGCSGMAVTGVEKAPIAFNSFGIRDKEYDRKAPAGRTRILVLGSSNTLGPGLREEDTWPRALERYLQGRGFNAEVINGSMVGYCTVQTATRIRDFLERYFPDIVVYQTVQAYCPLYDGAWAGRVVSRNGEPLYIDRNPLDPEGMFAGLNRAIQANRTLFYLWLTATDQIRKAWFSWGAYFAGREGRLANFLAPTVAHLKYMDKAVRESGGKFFTMSYRMWTAQTIPSQMYLGLANFLARFTYTVPVPGEDTVKLLAGENLVLFYHDFPVWKYQIPGDVHFNKEGLEILARLTGEKLVPYLGKPVPAPKRRAK